jgi:hypothetical protein
MGRRAIATPTAVFNSADILLALAGFLLALGLVLVVWQSSTKLVLVAFTPPNARNATTSMPATMPAVNSNTDWRFMYGGCWCIVAAFVAMAAAVPLWQKEKGDGVLSSERSYNRHLVAVSYSLMLLGLLNFVALGGFAYVDRLEGILKLGKDAAANKADLTIFMFLLPGFAVLGALLFVADSLRHKRDLTGDDDPPVRATALLVDVVPAPAARPADTPPNPSPRAPTATPALPVVAVSAAAPAVRAPEPFDASRFWAGLWYRLGEAIVFALVLFLLGYANYANGLRGATLLLVALLIGMFVKTGETLIAGLTRKVFAAVESFVK